MTGCSVDENISVESFLKLNVVDQEHALINVNSKH